MSLEHPFQLLFESFGRLPSVHAAAVNRLAYQTLCEVLTVPLEHAGRCILLRAPRAGCGKTHLLSHLQHHLGTSHEFIPLHAAAGNRIDATSVTADTLRRLTRLLPAAGALCELDLLVRRLFSLALQPLVSSGEVPCQDRDGALASLHNHPLETFDFHHPNAVTAHWTRDNFAVLGPQLSMELAHLTGLPPHALGFWVEALFRFAATPIDHPGRVDALSQGAIADSAENGAAMERLAALLALVALLRRVVLLADDLEGFSADETAALRLTSFVGSLRQPAERLDVIISLNHDVWESAFVPRLSDGLADRMSEVLIELEPLTDEAMAALLESRVPGLGARMLQAIGPEHAERHARSLLRAAGAAWLTVTRTTAPTAQSDPAASPPPQAPVTPCAWQEPAPQVSAPPAPSIGAALDAEPSSVEVTAPPPLVAPLEPEPPVMVPAAASPCRILPEQPPPSPPLAAAPALATLAAPEIDTAEPAATRQEAPAPTSPDGSSPPETPTPPAQPAADVTSPEPAGPVDSARVRDLLRQFRERYGRPDP
ncbi:MAG: hypothetical protein NTW21_06450 [Verrucomicrobia bacterium]|nr:hypothetical protein [Verrucomicrobiota bacterium]